MESSDYKKNANGILSLGGFAFQIKVFVFFASMLEAGSQLEFETIEDIALSQKFDAEMLDEKTDLFRGLLKSQSSYKAIQVKRSTLTNSIKEKILFNWLLLEDEERTINEYILVTEFDTVSELVDSNFGIESFYKKIMVSKKKANALISKVKVAYADDYTKFSLAIESIRNKYVNKNFTEIDNEIKDSFNKLLHRGAVSEDKYTLRIKELLGTITIGILESIYNKDPYLLPFVGLLRLVDDICIRINNDSYEPDYTTFRKISKVNITDEKIIKSREYRQLLSCELNERRIEEHLIYLQYYDSIRYRYLEDNKLNVIRNIENTSYNNFCDVKELLLASNDDSPIKRLIRTKEKNNTYVYRDQARFGSCIYLTKDIIREDEQISWEDENE